MLIIIHLVPICNELKTLYSTIYHIKVWDNQWLYIFFLFFLFHEFDNCSWVMTMSLHYCGPVANYFLSLGRSQIAEGRDEHNNLKLISSEASSKCLTQIDKFPMCDMKLLSTLLWLPLMSHFQAAHSCFSLQLPAFLVIWCATL